MKKIKIIFGVIAGFLTISTSYAQEEKPDVSSLISSEIVSEIDDFLNNEIVLKSISNQNIKYKSLSQENVVELDELWRKQTKSDDKYMIAATLSSPLSAYLTRIQAHSGGKFIEIFVMDNNGLNVGQSSVTSDFWQGDEAKWQKSFQGKTNAVFIDEAEYNEDKKRWSVQYNKAISIDGKNIGAATVELNLTELKRLAAE